MPSTYADRTCSEREPLPYFHGLAAALRSTVNTIGYPRSHLFGSALEWQDILQSSFSACSLITCYFTISANQMVCVAGVAGSPFPSPQSPFLLSLPHSPITPVTLTTSQDESTYRPNLLTYIRNFILVRI